MELAAGSRTKDNDVESGARRFEGKCRAERMAMLRHCSTSLEILERSTVIRVAGSSALGGKLL